jgi:hypothetical protein
MANIIYSAKPASKWSKNELSAYNITIQTQSVIDFFGHELRSIDHLDPNLLFSIQSNPPTRPPNGTSVDTLSFLNSLSCIWHDPDCDPAINNLMRSVLRVTGFERDAVIVMRCKLSLAIM